MNNQNADSDRKISYDDLIWALLWICTTLMSAHIQMAIWHFLLESLRPLPIGNKI